jgi:hypothetical protein
VTLQFQAIHKSVKNHRGAIIRTEPDQYAIKSACGRFTVCKIVIGGKPTFEAWEGRTRLGSALDAAAAKAICEGVNA